MKVINKIRNDRILEEKEGKVGVLYMIVKFIHLAKTGGLLECDSWSDGQSAAEQNFRLENMLGRS